jgi:uncharacterized protein YndB with AHSA1/START domain
VTRTHAASPARVFKGFADEQARAKWFAGPPGFVELEKR